MPLLMHTAATLGDRKGLDLDSDEEGLEKLEERKMSSEVLSSCVLLKTATVFSYLLLVSRCNQILRTIFRHST